MWRAGNRCDILNRRENPVYRSFAGIERHAGRSDFMAGRDEFIDARVVQE